MWALIANDVVTETTDVDPDGRFHPSFVWVECPDEVAPRWNYIGGTFSPPIEVEPETVIIVNAVDLWSRMTDAEADEVGSVMIEQPLRIRRIFDSASTYRSDHELWSLLEQIATSLFGEDRAKQILAPSA